MSELSRKIKIKTLVINLHSKYVSYLLNTYLNIVMKNRFNSIKTLIVCQQN